MFIGELLESVQSGRIVDIHTGAATHNADLTDSGIGKSVHFPVGDLRDPVDFAHVIFPLKNLNAFQGDRTGKRISHKGGSVHQCFPVVITVKRFKDFMVGNCYGMTDIAAGQCFA